MNEGSVLIIKKLERYELVKFNFKVGKKVKVLIVYVLVLRYLEIGLELLEENSW